MKRSVVGNIVDYLFHGLPQPFDILGQNNYGKIKTSLGNSLIEIGGLKQILLKTLLDILFVGPTRTNVFNSDNTIPIDDSPKKSVCNETRNLIFLQTWT
jgi:hypothetical protein